MCDEIQLLFVKFDSSDWLNCILVLQLPGVVLEWNRIEKPFVFYENVVPEGVDLSEKSAGNANRLVRVVFLNGFELLRKGIELQLNHASIVYKQPDFVVPVERSTYNFLL